MLEVPANYPWGAVLHMPVFHLDFKTFLEYRNKYNYKSTSLKIFFLKTGKHYLPEYLFKASMWAPHTDS